MKTYEELVNYINEKMEFISSEMEKLASRTNQNEDKLEQLSIERERLINEEQINKNAKSNALKLYIVSVIQLILSLIIILMASYVSFNPAFGLKLSSKIIYGVIAIIELFTFFFETKSSKKYRQEYLEVKEADANLLANDFRKNHLQELEREIENLQQTISMEEEILTDLATLLETFEEKKLVAMVHLNNEDKQDFDMERFLEFSDELSLCDKQEEQILKRIKQ